MTDTPDPAHEPAATSHVVPKIRGVALGMWQTNCYILSVPGGSDPKGCWIVDCGQKPQPLFALIESAGLTPRGILLTHCHVDHIMGVDEALAKYGPMPILCHALEREWNGDPMLNLSGFVGGMEVGVTLPTATVADGQTLDLCGSSWKAMHVPGHSPGSLAYVHHASRQALSGDVLFAGGIGRFDFPGCDGLALKRSLQVMMALPDEMTIYPGHGPSTTIGRERRTNPYVLRPGGW
jgi:hydroxyacylglutathione hydrolase